MVKNYGGKKSGFKKSNKKFKTKPKKPAGGMNLRGKLLYGTHACIEAMKNPDRKIYKIHVTQKLWDNVIAEMVSENRGTLPDPEFTEKDILDTMLPNGAVHQGIAIDVSAEEEVFLNDIIIKSKTRDKTLLVMIDQVTDPHNIGAILRSAAGFGAMAMIGQNRHMPDVTPAMAKIACGAVEHVPILREKNLSEALETLKDEGFTCIGLDERGESTLAEMPKSNKMVIVMGAEGKGLRPWVADTCTHLARLPTRPPIASLNVSNAAAIALYEFA